MSNTHKNYLKCLFKIQSPLVLITRNSNSPTGFREGLEISTLGNSNAHHQNYWSSSKWENRTQRRKPGEEENNRKRRWEWKPSKKEKLVNKHGSKLNELEEAGGFPWVWVKRDKQRLVRGNKSRWRNQKKNSEQIDFISDF